jgi:hypothetical protein
MDKNEFMMITLCDSQIYSDQPAGGDNRIMAISANKFQQGQSRTPYSYYFSRYNPKCVCISWQRALYNYDVDMKNWPDFLSLGLMRSICDGEPERRYWTEHFQRVYNGQNDTWNYQCTYAYWSQSGLAILPDLNLVPNIEFSVDTTHTTGTSAVAALLIQDMWEIKDSPFVTRQQEADNYTRDKSYGLREQSFIDLMGNKIKKVIPRLSRL